MSYCPKCGKKLFDYSIDNNLVKKCHCGFIDWNNSVNLAAIVIGFNDKNDFLMVKIKKKSEENKITFPGGYRNLGESIEKAAEREFLEETGHQISNLRLYKTYTRDDIHLVWIVYLAKIISGDFIDNDETKEILFYNQDNGPLLSDLRGSLTIKLYQDLLDDYQSILKHF